MKTIKNMLKSIHMQENKSWFSETGTYFLEFFPKTVVLEILKFLTPTELCRISRVSKEMHSLATDNFVWKAKLLEAHYSEYELSTTPNKPFKQIYIEFAANYWTPRNPKIALENRITATTKTTNYEWIFGKKIPKESYRRWFLRFYIPQGTGWACLGIADESIYQTENKTSAYCQKSVYALSSYWQSYTNGDYKQEQTSEKWKEIEYVMCEYDGRKGTFTISQAPSEAKSEPWKYSFTPKEEYHFTVFGIIYNFSSPNNGGISLKFVYKNEETGKPLLSKPNQN